MNPTCLVPECGQQAVAPGFFLCEVHVQRLRQNRLRAEVLQLVKARPSQRVLPDRDPTVVLPGDYIPGPLRQAVSPALAAELHDASLYEPVLMAMPCPVEKMPVGVKSATKLAKELGYEHYVTIAIGPEPEMITSVVMRIRGRGVYLYSRHESKPNATALGFKIAWVWRKPKALPEHVGWRQLTSILRGEEPDVDERRALLDAMDLVGDRLRAQVVRVEAN